MAQLCPHITPGLVLLERHQKQVTTSFRPCFASGDCTVLSFGQACGSIDHYAPVFKTQSTASNIFRAGTGLRPARSSGRSPSGKWCL